MTEIRTSRLRLLSLSRRQLECCLSDLPALEGELGISIARDVIDGNVIRALGMKIQKMTKAEVSRHDWFTYWLIVIKENNLGAGPAGFKGYPDEHGSTEIGYGIDPAFQNKGYT